MGGDSHQQLSMIPKIINGGIAGMAGITAVFPLDLVKTRLQNQQIGPNGEKMYNNIFDCFVKTFKSDGFFGMYKGVAVYVAMITPEKAIKLAANDFFRHHLTAKDGSLNVTRQIIAATFTCCSHICITSPMELLKIQMQDAGRTRAAGVKGDKTLRARYFAWQIYQESGILGLYKGLGATLLRDIPFSIIYFPSFAYLNNLGPRREDADEATSWWSFIAGCIGGGLAGFLVTPFDVIKTRYQTLEKKETEETCTTLKDCAVKVWKNEGFFAFFKGGACRVMVIAPLFGVAQAAYYLGIGEWITGLF